MTNPRKQPDHPGRFVRKSVIPTGMTVKDAANRLGIGRPALSNLLNGNASLSPEMAARLEKAFGADRTGLLQLQAEYDQWSRINSENELVVRAFVPGFLTIKSEQIEDWAEKRIDARTHLPVLLRKLVHSTGTSLHKVDFPGYDNAERKGSDGIVESGAATPWIPEGRSYWEFGTNKTPSAKANSDYNNRLKSIEAAERANCTYVVVTPRNWEGKAAWEKKKNEAGDWKAVRVFDASDLEQWLEQSVPAQIWFAEQIGQPSKGFETLEQAWRNWAHASTPHLTKLIFEPSLSASRETIRQWLIKPSEKSLVVAADSRGEALAFLACVFEDEELCRYKDHAAAFSSPETLRKLISSSVPFIPIVYSEEAERELADAHLRLHCIIFRPRNAVDKEPDIALDLLNFDTFKNALTGMGFEPDDIDRLAMESGRSPTVLRRRISENAAIQVPAWASDSDMAKSHAPMALVGAWYAESKADREVLERIAGRDYDVIEHEFTDLLHLDDSPVWSAGGYCGVASKIDSLFAIARSITKTDINRFLEAANIVLSESDPSLDLPEKDRWAAAFYGKKRDYSAALRDGICETLVVLSVHGNSLFHDRLNMDVEGRINDLVSGLLTPLTLEKLLSHDHDLPRYAEAAPDRFLRIIENNLDVVVGLLKPVDSGLPFASPSRTGLLWALESLAWKPQNLPRVAAVLARLSEIRIDDNWLNKPVGSLQSIFRSRMPQTAASVEERIKVLEMLSKRFPQVCWDICIQQIKPGSRVGQYSYKPRWRSDASGAGQVVSRREMYEFDRKALDFLIGWPTHNEGTLGDLIESLQAIPKEDQSKVWDLIDEWAKSSNDAAKAALRERIRRFAFTRRGQKRNLEDETRSRARATYEALQPLDPVIRHSWLFADHWVQESVDEIEDENYDYHKRDEHIKRQRIEAMTQIWAEAGFDGVQDLLKRSGAPSTVGIYASSCIEGVESSVDFTRCCLALEDEMRINAELCLQGFLVELGDDLCAEVINTVAIDLSDGDSGRLFACAPFRESTWRLLDEHREEVRARYWANVLPTWGRYSPAELSEITDRLFEAQRPRAAFHAVHLDFKSIETSHLKHLLKGVATVDAEPKGHYRLDPYYISEALDSLEGRASVSIDEMAQLEFLFLDALDDTEHGVPNLARQVAKSPAFFAEAVLHAYKRSDDGNDPSEFRIENSEKHAAIAMAAHRLLSQVNKMPGEEEEEEKQAAALTEWIAEARHLCHKYARADIGDQCIGQLLARVPVGKDDEWPREAICEAMEGTASFEIGTGFQIGVINSRGAHWRGEGGEQERELAEKFRAVAERLHFSYPYMGGIIEGIATSYDREAEREDAEAMVNKRLRH